MRRRASAGIATVTVVGALVASAVVPATASGIAGAGRQSRTSHVAVAGADVFLWSRHRSVSSGDACTLSFAVRSRQTHRVGSLTAGHCVTTLAGRPGYTVHQTRAGKRNTTDPGDRLGVVHAGAYRLGRNGDSAFVALSRHRQAIAEVFIGGAASHTTIPIAGVAGITDGMHVCYSGAASGEHCGFTVIGRPSTVGFRDGHGTLRIRHEWRATRHTCSSRVGDSGAPVYVKRNGKAYAVGILSGGQVHTRTCPFYFTSVRLALTKLHLELLTAS